MWRTRSSLPIKLLDILRRYQVAFQRNENCVAIIVLRIYGNDTGVRGEELPFFLPVASRERDGHHVAWKAGRSVNTNVQVAQIKTYHLFVVKADPHVTLREAYDCYKLLVMLLSLFYQKEHMEYGSTRLNR